jgi:hypothetical protein
MTVDRPEPLDAELADLLRAEKDAVVAPVDAKARVRSRLDAVVGGPVPPVLPSLAGPSSTSMGPAAALLRRAPALALAFLLGGVTGALVLNAARPAPEPAIVYVDRAPAPAMTPRTTAVAEIDRLAVPSTDVAALPIASASSASSRAPASSAPAISPLAEEQAVLDVARVALARREGADALAAVAKHERRFPSGALAEEREAIAIQALVLLLHRDEARARGEAFARRFPQSMLSPVVEAALRTIP